MNFKMMVGFCSDGASNMTGVHNGLGVKLQALNPHLVTFHCMAHWLALVAVSALKKEPVVGDYCDFLNFLVTYVNRSPMRVSALQKSQDELQIKQRKLIRPAATRWLSFDDACYAFHKTFLAVVLFLHRECKKESLDTAYDDDLDEEDEGVCRPKYSLRQMKKPNFILSHALMRSVLPSMSTFSMVLQTTDVTIEAAMQAQSDFINGLKNALNGATYFTKVVEFVDFWMTKMSLVEDEVKWTPKVSQDDCKTFHSTVAQSYVNALLSQVKDRFRNNQTLSAFTALFHPSRYPQSITEKEESDDEDDELDAYARGHLSHLLGNYGNEKLSQDGHSVPAFVSKKDTKNSFDAFKLLVVRYNRSHRENKSSFVGMSQVISNLVARSQDLNAAFGNFITLGKIAATL